MMTKRMSPWELNKTLYDNVEGRRWATRQTWRAVMEEGLKLWLEAHKDLPCLVGAQAVAESAALPAAVSPAVSSPAVAPISAAVVPVVSVPQTKAEKLVERLRVMIEQSASGIDIAKARLLIEPGHVPSKTMMRELPSRLVEDQAALVEAEKVLAAELSSKQIDNGENEVED